MLSSIIHVSKHKFDCLQNTGPPGKPFTLWPRNTPTGLRRTACSTGVHTVWGGVGGVYSLRDVGLAFFILCDVKLPWDLGVALISCDVGLAYFIQCDLWCGYWIQWDLGLVYLIQWDLGSLLSGYMAYVIGNWVYLFHGIWDWSNLFNGIWDWHVV